MSRIPVLVPRMPATEHLLPYLRRIDASRAYTNFGPLSAAFEARVVAEVAPTLTVEHVASVANCTIGLELALQACGLRAGARVLIPAVSFVATASAVTRVGMIPVIADVDPATWCLTPAIAERTRTTTPFDAVMPVATFGRPQEVEAWDAFTAQSGCPVIVDAAGAFGNQGVGRTTDVVFSFHATKTLGSGEGGAVVSSDRDRVAHIRRLSNFGIDITIGEAVDVGTNGKLSEYHCAVGLASFDLWPQTRRDRIALYARYREELRATCPTLGFQDKPADGIYPVFPVLLPAGYPSVDVARALAAAGIETRRWYCPALHRHRAFQGVVPVGPVPVAELLESRLLGLPFFLDMTDEQRATVCEQLRLQLASPHGVPHGDH